MKKKITIITLLTLIALVSACSHKNTDMTNQTQSNNQVVDTTTGPSWVTDDQSLDTAVKDSWIVIITKNLKTDRELVFEGAFKKGDEVVPRLLALYNQDENHVKTTSYTLTPPN